MRGERPAEAEIERPGSPSPGVEALAVPWIGGIRTTIVAIANPRRRAAKGVEDFIA
jgi:hypothetical protein